MTMEITVPKTMVIGVPAHDLGVFANFRVPFRDSHNGDVCALGHCWGPPMYGNYHVICVII